MVVWRPILVVLFGYGILPKLIIVALICFFPIVVNGLDGLRSVDDDFIRMMRTLDAGRWAIFRRVEFPAALPLFFSGMRIAATFASIGAVFGEWAGSNAGLGYVMLEADAQSADGPHVRRHLHPHGDIRPAVRRGFARRTALRALEPAGRRSR